MTERVTTAWSTGTLPYDEGGYNMLTMLARQLVGRRPTDCLLELSGRCSIADSDASDCCSSQRAILQRLARVARVWHVSAMAPVLQGLIKTRMTKRGCAMTCRRRVRCLLRVRRPPRRRPRPRPPTPFPLSRECMRPKLYMSMVESPSFAFFYYFYSAHAGLCKCSAMYHYELQCLGSTERPTRERSSLHPLPLTLGQ